MAAPIAATSGGDPSGGRWSRTRRAPFGDVTTTQSYEAAAASAAPSAVRSAPSTSTIEISGTSTDPRAQVAATSR